MSLDVFFRLSEKNRRFWRSSPAGNLNQADAAWKRKLLPGGSSSSLRNWAQHLMGTRTQTLSWSYIYISSSICLIFARHMSMNLETFFKCEWFKVAVYMHFSFRIHIWSTETNPAQKPYNLPKNLSDKSFDGREDKIFCFRCQETKKVCKDQNSTQILPPLLRIWTSWPRFRFSPFFPDSSVSPLSYKDLFCHVFNLMKGKILATSMAKSFNSQPSHRHQVAQFLLWKLCHGKGAKDQENWWWNFLNSRVSSERPSQTTKSSNDTCIFCRFFHMWYDMTQHDMSVWWRVERQVKADKIRMIHCWHDKDHLLRSVRVPRRKTEDSTAQLVTTIT